MHALNNCRIEWLKQQPLLHSTCPVCGQSGDSPRILNAWRAGADTAHALARCQKCASLFLEHAETVHYDDIAEDRAMFIQHYLEAGAGPWEMFWPAASVQSSKRQTLLDVGCGFGWMVDIWSNIFDAPATGVEAAFWGRLGRETFEANILDGYTSEHPELGAHGFDIVYACEVIEHVPDPKAFIAELSRYVADHGVLVLTTPAAEFITPEQDDHDIVSALCPGGHLFILGAEKLTGLLRDAGYSSVNVFRRRERLFAFASRTEIGPYKTSRELSSLYEKYLADSRMRFASGTLLHDGILYRLIKQKHASGLHADALALGAELEESLRIRFEADLSSPRSIIDTSDRIVSWNTWGRHLPYFLGSYAYFKGESLLNQTGRIELPQEWLIISIILGKRCAQLSSPHFGEAIQCMWRAYSLLIQIAIASKRPADGLGLFKELCAAGTGTHPAFGGAFPPLNLLASSACALVASFLERSDTASIEAVWMGCSSIVSRPNNDPEAHSVLKVLADRSKLPDSDAASGLLEASIAGLISSPEAATSGVGSAARQLLAALRARRKTAASFSTGLAKTLHGAWSGQATSAVMKYTLPLTPLGNRAGETMDTLYLHIGMHKTGSSSIQSSLARFKTEKLRYAHLGEINHSIPLYTIFSEDRYAYHIHRRRGFSREMVDAHRERYAAMLRRELERRSGDMIISGEDLSILSESELKALETEVRPFFRHVKVIGYTRNPIDYASSALQEQIKNGVTPTEIPRPAYRDLFEKFHRVFGKDHVLLIDFRRSNLFRGSVVQDFLHRVGAPADLITEQSENESLSLLATKLMYAFKRSGTLCDGAEPLVAARDQFVRLLRTAFAGEAFRLPDHLAHQAISCPDVEWLFEQTSIDYRPEHPAPLLHDAVNMLDRMLVVFSAQEVQAVTDLVKKYKLQHDPADDVSRLLTRLYYAVLMRSTLEETHADAILNIALKHERGESLSSADCLYLLRLAQHIRPGDAQIAAKLKEHQNRGPRNAV